jgi:hypothetical protein
MNTTEPQHATPKFRPCGHQDSLRKPVLLALLAVIVLGCLGGSRTWAEDPRDIRLQRLVTAARTAKHDWERAREANRIVPGTVTIRELRQLHLLSERAELDVERVRSEGRGLEVLHALDIRRATIDVEWAQLEMQWVRISSGSSVGLNQAQRLEPPRQLAILAIRLLHDAGPQAKDAIPVLVSAMDDPDLKSDARSALERIDPDWLKATSGNAK